jgi:chaperonin GroES
MILNFQPLGDRVLLRRIIEDVVRVGSLVIPDAAKEKPYLAEVIAVGEGYRTDAGWVHPLRLKIGQKVIIGKWSGTELKLSPMREVQEGPDGTTDVVEYLIAKEEEILGYIREGN